MGVNRRFTDRTARISDKPVHSVEMSGSGAESHFVTLYCKETWREFGERHGLDPWKHNKPYYHLDGVRWVRALFPSITHPHWDRHYHIDLDHPPELADLERFTDDLPECVLNALSEALQGADETAPPSDD